MGLISSQFWPILLKIYWRYTNYKEQQYLTIYSWLYAQKLSGGLDHLFTAKIKSEKMGLLSSQHKAITVITRG